MLEIPTDFTEWEKLVKTAESNAAPDIVELSSILDQFLDKWPLCYGYWKKYADWELRFKGPNAADMIYKRAVFSIDNSVDLWNHYCLFRFQTNFPDDQIRRYFSLI